LFGKNNDNSQLLDGFILKGQPEKNLNQLKDLINDSQSSDSSSNKIYPIHFQTYAFQLAETDICIDRFLLSSKPL
jgi:hypothetical protein